MEITQIPQADILDIIFDGRNKEYGAYDLRKSYNRRLTKSLALTGSFCLLLIGSYVVAGKMDKSRAKYSVVDADVVLKEIQPPLEKPVELPPPPKLHPQQVAMKIFTIPKIVPPDQVKPEEVPPKNDDLENVKIGTVNKDGDAESGIVAPPPGDGGKGILEAPVQKDNDDEVFKKVEIESYYGPGLEAWKRFLLKNFNPDKAIEAGLTGTITVTVQFIVDLEGNVSDVEAVSGPEELRKEAIRVIKKSGRWEPAIQNGRRVKSYKKQPITVQVSGE